MDCASSHWSTSLFCSCHNASFRRNTPSCSGESLKSKASLRLEIVPEWFEVVGEARSDGDRAKCTVPFPHPSRQKFSNDRCGGGARCVIQAITLSSCQEEKNGQDLMRAAPGGFDKRLITAGLAFFFCGGGCGGGAGRKGFNFSVGPLRN